MCQHIQSDRKSQCKIQMNAKHQLNQLSAKRREEKNNFRKTFYTIYFHRLLDTVTECDDAELFVM